jgi:hypothetical protein
MAQIHENVVGDNSGVPRMKRADNADFAVDMAIEDVQDLLFGGRGVVVPRSEANVRAEVDYRNVRVPASLNAV